MDEVRGLEYIGFGNELTLEEERAVDQLLKEDTGQADFDERIKENLDKRMVMPTTGGLGVAVLHVIDLVTKKSEIAYGAYVEAVILKKYGKELATGHVYSATGALLKEQLIEARTMRNPSGHGKPITSFTLTPRGRIWLEAIKSMLK